VVGCDIKDIGGVFVEETIKIKWNEKEEEVVIGRLSFGQRNEAIRKCLKTKLQGTQQTRDVDEVLLKELNLLYSICLRESEWDRWCHGGRRFIG
jgi:hypothetical protein